MKSGDAIAIDLGRRRVRVLLAGAGRGRGILKIKRTLVEDYPSDLNADDPEAVGRWLGGRLIAARVPRGRATIAIGREHVGLKRMTLPTSENDELPDMTRLAMQRELPFDADSAVIDFVPVERRPASTTVLAVAVPRPVIDFACAMARAAGVGIERISLRTMGAAALLNGMDQEDSMLSKLEFGLKAAGNGAVEVTAGANGSTVGSPQQDAVAVLDWPRSADRAAKPQRGQSASGLAIDVTGEGVEFCLVANGAIRFSRAAEVPQPQDQLAIADAVVTETRRTWMSYRIGDDAGDVQVALVMGDRRVSEYAAGPLEQMLKVPVQVVGSHPRIDANGHEMDRHWPLAGLLLERALSAEVIDFSRPRRAPDVGARTRQRRLA
ncbi:MAG: hypothetical protein L0219_03120, partial [Phycisphaerales bacterium]|nr:hypothetical protein [Phycisphaerales bacterium]